MIFKLKTSSETMKIFGELGANIHLQPFALCKIAIALSLRNMEKLDDDAFKTNNEGFWLICFLSVILYVALSERPLNRNLTKPQPRNSLLPIIATA